MPTPLITSGAFNTLIQSPHGNKLVGRRTWSSSKSRTNDYSYRLRNGIPLPVLPYSRSRVEDNWDVFKKSSSRVNYSKGIFTHTFTYDINIAGVITFRDPSSDAEARALKSLFQNAKQYKSSVGVTLGELPKTVSLIGDTATKLGSAFRRLRKLDVYGAVNALGAGGMFSRRETKHWRQKANSVPKNAKSKFDFASNTWLEMTYGWTPLLSELDNAAHDLANRFQKQPHELRIRGGATSDELVALEWSYANGISRQLDVDPVNSTQVGYVIFVSVLNANLRTYAGLGLTNPLEIAWELLPFSFVADWFLPIGGWIDSLDAFTGLTFQGGSRSVKRIKQYGERANGTYDSPESASYFICSGEGRKYKSFNFSRAKLTTIPSGFGMLNLKGIDDIFGTRRTVTALALLQQAFRL